MNPAIATAVWALIILGLLWLDREREVRTSGALWIPVVWVALCCSRSVAQWLQIAPIVDSSDQALDGSPIDRLCYTALMLLGIIVVVRRSGRVGKLLRANGAVLWFFLYCAVSLLWSDYPGVGFRRWTKAIGDLVMVLIVLSDPEPEAAIERLLARTGDVLVPLSVLLIKYYPTLAREYDRWTGRAFYTGAALNKNGLGAICLLFGLGAAWRFLKTYQEKQATGRTRRLVAQGATLAMVMWLFGMANSMTSESCFLLATGLILAINLRSVDKRPWLVHALVVVTILVCASIAFLGMSPGLLAAMGRNPTLTDRTEVWGLILSLKNNFWLGTGFESFWLGPRLQQIWSVYDWQPTEAHNGYIEIFLNLGATGILLLAIVIVAGYRTAIAAWRRNPQFGSLCLALFVVGVVYNFTEAAFFRIMTPVWIFFLLATTRVPDLLYSGIQTVEQELSPEEHPVWGQTEIVANLNGRRAS